MKRKSGVHCSTRIDRLQQPAYRDLPVIGFYDTTGDNGASVYRNIHSMCNGANLAYTKKAFEEVGGFTGIDHIASGDDMLLMHKIYRRYPT